MPPQGMNFGNTRTQGGQPGMFGGDPAMIQAQASVNQALAFAEQEAMREMRQLLIDYGDPELAAKYLKEPGTESDYWQINAPQGQQAAQGAIGRLQAAQMMTHKSPYERNQWGTLDRMRNSKNQPRPMPVDPALFGPARVGQGMLNQFGRQFGSQQEAEQALGLMGLGGRYGAEAMQRKQGKGVNVLAAENNPYSVLKNLGRTAGAEQYEANENLNKANLWYSSERGRVLEELGRTDQQRRYEAARTVQQQLADIQAQLTGTQMQAQQNYAAQVLQSQQQKSQQVSSIGGG